MVQTRLRGCQPRRRATAAVGAEHGCSSHSAWRKTRWDTHAMGQRGLHEGVRVASAALVPQPPLGGWAPRGRPNVGALCHLNSLTNCNLGGWGSLACRDVDCGTAPAGHTAPSCGCIRASAVQGAGARGGASDRVVVTAGARGLPLCRVRLCSVGCRDPPRRRCLDEVLVEVGRPEHHLAVLGTGGRGQDGHQVTPAGLGVRKAVRFGQGQLRCWPWSSQNHLRFPPWQFPD